MDNICVRNNIITFKDNFNNDLDDKYYDIIKNSNINTIHFNDYFKGNILNLPDNITCIKFSKNVVFNGKLVLPSKLEILIMPSKYNYKLIFPDTLKLLIIYEYNYDLDNLPSDLHELRLLGDNNVKINMFPINLKKLILGIGYKQKIDIFPEGLQVFIDTYNYNYPIDNFPNSLINVVFGSKFQQDINLLPDSIKYLTLNCDYTKKINKYPNNLEELIIDGDNFYDRSSGIITIDFNILPQSIKKIKFDSRCAYNIINVENINNLVNLEKIITYDGRNYQLIKDILIDKNKIILNKTKY